MSSTTRLKSADIKVFGVNLPTMVIITLYKLLPALIAVIPKKVIPFWDEIPYLNANYLVHIHARTVITAPN